MYSVGEARLRLNWPSAAMQGRHVVSVPSMASAAFGGRLSNLIIISKVPWGVRLERERRLENGLRIKMRACVGTKRGSYPRAANPIGVLSRQQGDTLASLGPRSFEPCFM